MTFTRRWLLGASLAATAVATIERPAAQGTSDEIGAVAFDAFALFDARPVFAACEAVAPGRGNELANLWRTRQFEYQWLRALGQQYQDFHTATGAALEFAARALKIDLATDARERLMHGFLELRAWPDVTAALRALRQSGKKLALLSNATPSILTSALRNSDLLGDTRARLRETEGLQRIAGITSSTLNLDEMLESAVREAADLLDVEGAILMMPDPAQAALAPHERSRYGIARDLPFGPLPFDSLGHMTYVYQSGEPYVSNDAPLADGDLLLIDAACELDGYAADITRTFPVNGRFSAAQRDVYEMVLAAQYAAIEASRPGRHWNEPHEAALRVIAQGLVDLKLCQGSVDGVLESEGYKRFYMHRTGHWLGMDVHDAGAYKVDGEWRVLQPGMTFTVEPGCYIRPADDVPESLWNIGIRIEDNVAITEQGCDILTDATPKRVSQIEELMRP